MKGLSGTGSVYSARWTEDEMRIIQSALRGKIKEGDPEVIERLRAKVDTWMLTRR